MLLLPLTSTFPWWLPCCSHRRCCWFWWAAYALEKLQRAIRLDVILLLRILSSFSVALQTSGLANALATDMERLLLNWSGLLGLGGDLHRHHPDHQRDEQCGLCSAAGACGHAACSGLDLPAQAMLITVLFGASQSFLTPMGYQTNLMVFGPGRYRFFDVARYGAA